MGWTKLLAALATVGIVVWVVGALVSLVVGLGDGARATATAVVIGILLAALVAMTVVGAKGPRWLENPRHYW